VEAEAFGVLETFDFSTVPHSYCCGDLTLENVLMTPHGELYLIDFLDSFYNSWMMDVAKLLQDLELQWSYRHLPADANRDVRLFIAKEALKACVLGLPNGSAHWYTIHQLLLLNTLRIVPYSAEQPGTQAFLQNALAHVLTLLNQLSPPPRSPN
jgi:hypothetical protein